MWRQPSTKLLVVTIPITVMLKEAHLLPQSKVHLYWRFCRHSCQGYAWICFYLANDITDQHVLLLERKTVIITVCDYKPLLNRIFTHTICLSNFGSELQVRCIIFLLFFYCMKLLHMKLSNPITGPTLPLHSPDKSVAFYSNKFSLHVFFALSSFLTEKEKGRQKQACYADLHSGPKISSLRCGNKIFFSGRTFF
jgi:hypothetical protein